MSADEVMAIILHLAQNMKEELTGTNLPPPVGTALQFFAFVAAGRGSHGGRGHPGRGGRGGRGLPNMCNACGSMDHMLSSCTASDDARLEWTVIVYDDDAGRLQY
jgi:hypothetical protein